MKNRELTPNAKNNERVRAVQENIAKGASTDNSFRDSPTLTVKPKASNESRTRRQAK